MSAPQGVNRVPLKRPLYFTLCATTLHLHIRLYVFELVYELYSNCQCGYWRTPYEGSTKIGSLSASESLLYKIDTAAVATSKRYPDTANFAFEIVGRRHESVDFKELLSVSRWGEAVVNIVGSPDSQCGVPRHTSTGNVQSFVDRGRFAF